MALVLRHFLVGAALSYLLGYIVSRVSCSYK